jgi:Zn-dependent M28 family amino/carboxypeptidase
MRNKRSVIQISVIAVFAVLMSVSLVSSAVRIDTSALREAVTVEGVRAHQTALQAIADANDGTRVSGMAGYDASVAYVADQLTGAGYNVAIQNFSYDFWEELSLPVLEQISPTPTVYPPNDVAGFATMEYSESGDVTAPVVLADNFGCDPADFSSADFTGKIALIERGVCFFRDKAINAENAGALGAIVFNDAARQDAFFGTLGGPVVGIPVVGSSYAVGQDLIGEDVIAHLFVDVEITEDVSTSNVVAETPGGRDDRVVVVGAHLDSVAAGRIGRHPGGRPADG